MDTAPRTVIKTAGLTRTYPIGKQTVHALAGVDLAVPAGQFVALVGTSGSGKSTLLHILGCLDRPDGGAYELNGRPVHTLDDDALAEVRRRDLGFVFQAFNLLPRLRADENVALPLRYAGWPLAQRLERARELLEQVGLGSRIGHTPLELSGGQAQRVAIARALASDPPLLLADEPTGNLDSRSGAEILTLFEQLHDAGRTIVLVTHDEDVAHRAQRQIRMEDGQIVRDSLAKAP